uniref:Uncharacterized protein n=1 Tax=Rhizophora mucronata TaxID=61149 RepID=A0A2P2IRZ9_RHIMU
MAVDYFLVIFTILLLARLKWGGVCSFQCILKFKYQILLQILNLIVTRLLWHMVYLITNKHYIKRNRKHLCHTF